MKQSSDRQCTARRSTHLPRQNFTEWDRMIRMYQLGEMGRREMELPPTLDKTRSSLLSLQRTDVNVSRR